MPAKIFLADLAHTYSVGDPSLPIPLGIGYIKAYTAAAHGNRVDIRLFKHPERFLAALHAERPDVVGFAHYGWNENLNRAIGHHVRTVLPSSLLVAGGPNIDPDPTQRMKFLERHSYLNFAIADGGEEPFSELISWWQGDHHYDDLPGNMIWRDGESLRVTPERPLSKAIENIPSPYLSGVLDEFIAAGMIPMLETNRGCPFRCTFCAWGMASKDLVRRFDLDAALAEIAYIGERSKSRNWIFCDANFGILKRDVEIARALRAVKDRTGLPEKCHVWLAKNVTDRNLEIAAILEDMVVPVMAVQSMNDEVLKNIKRDNISIETYAAYQRRFHRLGSRTYSDVIVPLPSETLGTHLDGLRQLFDLDVDIIQNHNMRLLAGAETNSSETRQKFAFRTRYRLIHGDAGAYRAPDGTVIRCFEYEESLRSTSTMSEDEVFYLRKLHFLVDFCWNIDVYKDLLRTLKCYGVNPIDVFVRFLDATSQKPKNDDGDRGLFEFWREFDEKSDNEWFDTAETIEDHFLQPDNFERLLGQEFDKLNIYFGVVVLRELKREFDSWMYAIASGFGAAPLAVIDSAMVLSVALFPAVDVEAEEVVVDMPSNWGQLDQKTAPNFVPSGEQNPLKLSPSRNRQRVRRLLFEASGRTLSKILNTQGITLRDLRYAVVDSLKHGRQFRRAV